MLRLHAAIRRFLELGESLLEFANDHLDVVEDVSRRAAIRLRGSVHSLLQIVQPQQRRADISTDAVGGLPVVVAVMILHKVSSVPQTRGGGFVVSIRISRTSTSSGTGFRNTRSAPAARASSRVACPASAVATMIGISLVPLFLRRFSQTA